MEAFDVLILGAELSIALTGFAGIIATFQFRDGIKIPRPDAMGLTMIVSYSLLAAFQCSFILILNVIGIAEATLWTIGSILAATIALYNLNTFSRNIGRIRNKQLLTLMWILQSASIVLALANVLNALDIVFHRSPGPVLIGILWGLCLAGWMFSRLLLIPVWRTIRGQETNGSVAKA